MFRSLRAYRIHSDWPEDETALSARLTAQAFKPCPAFSESSAGFESPVENAGELLARSLAGADLVQLRIQSRVLPAGAVKEALAERVSAFTQRTAREPGRKDKRDLKEEVYAELLPKSLVKSDRVRAFYLRDEKLLVIATAAIKPAERLLEVLREALGSLQATPLEYRQPVKNLLNDIFLGKSTGGFHLGRECRMKDLAEPTSTVNWVDMDLADNSVRTHVKSGLSIDRLGIGYDGLLGATLDTELVVRKLRFEGLEELDDLDEEDPLARHDAEFTLTCGLISRLLAGLNKALGGYA